MDGKDGMDGAGKQKQASFFGRYVFTNEGPVWEWLLRY